MHQKKENFNHKKKFKFKYVNVNISVSLMMFSFISTAISRDMNLLFTNKDNFCHASGFLTLITYIHSLLFF